MTSPIADSYLYVRVQDNPNRMGYVHPVTGILRKPKYISAPSLKEFPNDVVPDYSHYADSIIKKAEPIYKAMGWSLIPISKDLNQQSLDAWW